MSKLPIPVPPPGDIDGLAETSFRFVVPAQRRPLAPGMTALRGITAQWFAPLECEPGGADEPVRRAA